jgi:hypothetical protein
VKIVSVQVQYTFSGIISIFVEIQNRRVKITLGGGGGGVILSKILTNRKWHFTSLDE